MRKNLTIESEVFDTAARAAIDCKIAEDAPDDRREFERVSRADRDVHVRVFGERIDDEIAIGGQRVEARFHQMLGTERARKYLRDELAHSPRDIRIGFESARVGVDGFAAGILRNLHRGLAENRKAVERRIVHPNPNRKCRRVERTQVPRRKIHGLLFGYFERNRDVELAECTRTPRTGSDNERPRVIALAVFQRDGNLAAGALNRAHAFTLQQTCS